ncbi:MAG: hypothetical protein ABIT58_11515 [Ferruginibacter sp.]
MRIKSTANKILIKSVLLIVYACFFSVQLIFGFTLFKNDSYTYNSSTSVVFGKAIQVEKNKHTDPKRFNIRLNKRFEPAGFPPVINDDLAVPFYYSVLKTVACNKQEFVSFLDTATRALRGPPVVA